MNELEIKNVTVCGAGVLGKQIAFHTAFNKFNVVLYDINEEAFEEAKAQFKTLGEIYKVDMNATQQDIDQSISRISYASELKEATKDADLVIETISEDIVIKKDFYTQLGKVAPKKSIFCTNSSTLIPSMFSQETGRPERFLALHFATFMWKNNIAEVMGHATTDKKVFDTIIEFSKAIGMVALPIYKEHPGHILNSLLTPLIGSALSLYANGVADPMTIDKTWIKAANTPMGPFGICDIVGINTVYDINKIAAEAGDENSQKIVEILQENYINKGKMGIHTGKGFYTYPNPAYENADFLK